MAKDKLPENVKQLKGTYRKDREKKNEPLSRGIPKMPKELLTKGGQKYWPLIIKRLARVGTLTEIDDLSVMITAESFARFMAASHFLEENGDTYQFTNKDGEVSFRARPEIKIANDSLDRVIAMFKQYGLTHVSRNNIMPLPDNKRKNKWGRDEEK